MSNMTHTHPSMVIRRQAGQALALSEVLSKQHYFMRVRYWWGGIAAIFAGLAGAVMVAASFSGTECIPLYTGFQGWNSDYGAVIAQCETGTSPCQCRVVGETMGAVPGPEFASEAQTLSDHFRARGESLKRYFDDFWRLGDGRDIAGITRFAAVLTAGLLTLFFYRELLDKAYEANMELAQLNQWHEMKQTSRHLFASLIMAFVVCMTTYIVTSALWMLFAEMFKQMALRPGGALLLTTVFVGLVGFVIMCLVTTLTTRRLFMLLLLTNGVGMGVMFVIAKQTVRFGEKLYWWQLALSSLGKQSDTGIMWTFGFVVLFLVLCVLWFDIADFFRDALNAPHQIVWRPGWLAHRLQRIFGSYFNGLRFFYFCAAVCLLSVGIVPVNHHSRLIFCLTFSLHTLAAITAVLIYWLGGMLLVTTRLRGIVFPVGFLAFSLTSFFTILVAVFMLLFHQLSMAAFELMTFTLCGIWLYAAIDNLLWYSDLKVLETGVQFTPESLYFQNIHATPT